MAQYNEQQLIVRCQNGDFEAFGMLYDAYIKKMYDFIYYKTHHKETAEDLTSITFTKAFEKVNTFNAKRGYFGAWLYRIARNTVIDYYRTVKNDTPIDDVWDCASREDISRDADARAKVKQVESYVGTLSSQQRDIIIMRLWQGMTHAEIARVLDTSEASAKMTYSRTMKKLHADIIPILTAFWVMLFHHLDA